MNEIDLSSIPAEACAFNIGEIEIGDNGDGAKTAPVKIVARSGKSVRHQFWGNTVHDMSGMHMHKARVPLDYAHDPKEVVGYLNRFDTASGDLVASGALVPFKDSDRATEILHKMRAGVPYEASINWGGDGIEIERFAMGQVARVNGGEFAGPVTVVRKWPLRGVAICPYGADANTETSGLAAGKKFTASVYKAEPAKTEDHAMSEQSVEVVAEAQTPKAEPNVEMTVDAQVPEAGAGEASAPAPAVDPPPAVDVPPAAEVLSEETPVAVAVAPVAEAPPAPVALSREEFARIADEFGDAIAARAMRDGGGYADALRWAYDGLKAEADGLRVQLAEQFKAGHGAPVPVATVPKSAQLFRVTK